MTWTYAYTPVIWVPLGTILFSLALAAYSLRRYSVPGALPFTFALLFGALWAAGSVLEYLAVDLATKITWIKFQAVWQLPAAVAITYFLLEYAWPGRWLTRRNLILLSIIPLLFALMVVTNDFHHLVWSDFAYTNTVTPLLGPVGWITIAYGYSFILVNFIVFAWLFLHFPHHRWFVVLMLVGELFLRAVYVLEKTQTIQSDLPMDVLGIAFAYLMYTIALFRFHVLNPVPLAREIVIDQMREGMLVVDAEGRVASLNPAAAAILGIPEKQACGRSIREILPSYAPSGIGSTGESEIRLRTGEGTRDYLLATSLLKDWRGKEAGRLLLLHDVTEQKQAREQQKREELLLATLQERERLARELHDSQGQTLAAAHLQASAARFLLAHGEQAQADKCLEQLSDMTLAAETDVREYLLGAKTAFSPDHPFFSTLREFVVRFSEQYGLRIELGIPPQLESAGLQPAAEVQLLRIIQEALSNVRKHSGAKNAQVIFTVPGTLVQVSICDDGQGFDPASTAIQQAKGFGLQSMRERAEGLGGCLEVISQAGQGTNVVVQVPVMGTTQ